jgi:hypothetical protein
MCAAASPKARAVAKRVEGCMVALLGVVVVLVVVIRLRPAKLLS